VGDFPEGIMDGHEASVVDQHLGVLLDILHTIREDFPRDARCDSRPFVLGTHNPHLSVA
jgi:hypothetical protein